MLFTSISGFVRSVLGYCSQAILYQFLGKQIKYLWKVAGQRGPHPEISDSLVLCLLPRGPRLPCALGSHNPRLCAWVGSDCRLPLSEGLLLTFFLTCRLHKWLANSGPRQNSVISRWDRRSMVYGSVQSKQDVIRWWIRGWPTNRILKSKQIWKQNFHDIASPGSSTSEHKKEI